MLNLENKTYVIMGIANKRSIAFGVAKVLDLCLLTLYTLNSLTFLVPDNKAK
jgi:enoyl-[acyl-carrier-protein] reductase (NADH)